MTEGPSDPPHDPKDLEPTLVAERAHREPRKPLPPRPVPVKRRRKPKPEPLPARSSLFRRLLITFLAVLATYAALTQLLGLRLSADVLSDAFQEQLADPTLVAVADSLAPRLSLGHDRLQDYLDSRYGDIPTMSIAAYDLGGRRLADRVGRPGSAPAQLEATLVDRIEREGAVRGSAGLGFVVLGPVDAPGGGQRLGYVRIAAQPATGQIRSLIFRTNWLWALPMFLLAALTAYLGTRSITARLREAEAAVQRMAAGDRNARIPVERLDEIGKIALTFNRTADQLQSSLRQLEATDAARRRLIADFAHELNTPLTNVLAYLETLMMAEEDGGMDTASRVGFLGVAYDEAKRLAHLARDLETLTKLEAGRLKMEQELVDLSRVAVELARRIIPRAEKQGLEVFTDIQPGAELVGDTMRLEQIGMNLLENGLRYTTRGSLTVSVRSDDTGVVLAIADTGSGIPPEDLPHVMSRFYRVDGSRTRATGGSGLGLAIVGGIVDRHSGRVSVDSEVGVGTTVSLWFPREGSVADVLPPTHD